MSELLFELPLRSAARTPEAVALRHRGATITYAQLATAIDALAGGLLSVGLQKLERVAIYLPKRLETVAAYFGTVRAGGVFVPVNPLLKPPQVAHILGDCDARVLITSSDRLRDLGALPELRSLRAIVTVDEETRPGAVGELQPVQWSQLLGAASKPGHRLIDMDMCAILYTSGSTGRPKGVVLSHRNMVTGARERRAVSRTTDRRIACWRRSPSVSTMASVSSRPHFTLAPRCR